MTSERILAWPLYFSVHLVLWAGSQELSLEIIARENWNILSHSSAFLRCVFLPESVIPLNRVTVSFSCHVSTTCLPSLFLKLKLDIFVVFVVLARDYFTHWYHLTNRLITCSTTRPREDSANGLALFEAIALIGNSRLNVLILSDHGNDMNHTLN